MNEDDLRVQRTRRLLREAIVDLMKTEEYEAITIRDITTQAQVGYKTFFRHYESKEALLQTLFYEFVDNLQVVLLSPTESNAPQKNTLKAIQYAEAHADLLLAILRSPISDQLLGPITEFAIDEGSRFFGGSDLPDELVAHHFASTILSLIQWWLEHGQPYSPEEMVGYINQLLLEPIANLTKRGQH